MISLLRQGSDPMRSGPLVRSKKRRHRGRTVSYPNRPRTDPGVPFSSTLCARAHKVLYVVSPKMWRPACKLPEIKRVVNVNAT